jgi:hypothetical protein
LKNTLREFINENAFTWEISGRFRNLKKNNNKGRGETPN